VCLLLGLGLSGLSRLNGVAEMKSLKFGDLEISTNCKAHEDEYIRFVIKKLRDEHEVNMQERKINMYLSVFRSLFPYAILIAIIVLYCTGVIAPADFNPFTLSAVGGGSALGGLLWKFILSKKQ
jgi:hypothetical protein